MDDPTDAADRIVVSYPTDLSDWGRDVVEGRPFVSYLRKAHESAEPDETWPEFVGVGCCGSAMDVPLRVEQVDGGSRLADETEVEFTVREACDVEGGWQVQSSDGPSVPEA